MQQKKYRHITSQCNSPIQNFWGIFCPKCHSFWLREYAPEYCYECGAKVTDNPGRANGVINDFVKLIRLGEFMIPVSKCNKCQLEYPGGIDLWIDGCLRCHGPLTQYGNYTFGYKVKRFIGKIPFFRYFVSREYRSSIRDNIEADDIPV